MLDGVFAQDGDAGRFHAAPSLDADDVADVLATAETHVTRLLAQRGVDAGDEGGTSIRTGQFIPGEGEIWTGQINLVNNQ